MGEGDEADDRPTSVPPQGLPRVGYHGGVRRSWRRGEEPEFGRVAFFTDAVFAIAMTLLVLDLQIPALVGEADDAGTMWDALVELHPRLISFVVAFVVLGGYWISNHTFFGHVGRVDHRYLTMNLAYLVFVIFLPFPTSLIGEYEKNPVSGAVFALSLAAVSGMETLLLRHAHHAGLLQGPMTGATYRYALSGSISPCAMFVVTIPLVLVSPTAMLLSWIVISPVAGAFLRRWRPADADTDVGTDGSSVPSSSADPTER